MTKTTKSCPISRSAFHAAAKSLLCAIVWADGTESGYRLFPRDFRADSEGRSSFGYNLPAGKVSAIPTALRVEGQLIPFGPVGISGNGNENAHAGAKVQVRIGDTTVTLQCGANATVCGEATQSAGLVQLGANLTVVGSKYAAA